jgi:hypothetical protein
MSNGQMWSNCEEFHDSWEPYATHRDTAQLNELMLPTLKKLISLKFKNGTSNSTMVSMRFPYPFFPLLFFWEVLVSMSLTSQYGSSLSSLQVVPP